MPVTADSIKALIVLEVGDTAERLVEANINTIWDSYADKAYVAPRLQELYTKRRAIDLLLGAVRALVDESENGTNLRMSQQATTLLALREQTEKEIGILEQRAQANRAPAIGLITTTAPVSQPLPLPAPLPADGNDRVYSGDLYRSLPSWPR